MEKKEQTISYTTAKHRVLRQKNISIIDPPTQMRTERNMTVQSRRLFMAALTHCCAFTQRDDIHSEVHSTEVIFYSDI
jgi:hypothetical protein